MVLSEPLDGYARTPGFNSWLLKRGPAPLRQWSLLKGQILQTKETRLPLPAALSGTGSEERVSDLIFLCGVPLFLALCHM